MAMGKCRECGTEVSTTAKTCPKCGVAKPARKTSMLVKIALGFVGITLGSTMISALLSEPSKELPTAPPPPPKSAKEIAMESLLLERLDWRKGGFDNVMFLDAKLRNKGTMPLKDVRIDCTLFSNSGTPVSKVSTVIYEVFPAGKVITTKEVNMGFIHQQSASVSCSVKDFVLL
jgi:hypothetical protein